MDARPIGVFDSGLGGLTVVKELMSQLPNESIVYFGDTARIPYGTRSGEIVTRYSAQCIRFLLSKNIKMVVIACNTASSTSLIPLKDIFDIPIIGVIDPGAAQAVEATINKRIGVIGTNGTIRSQAYIHAIQRRNSEIQVTDAPCPLFVPIVEEGWSDTDIALLTAERYLHDMQIKGVDTVILGCTHYPLLTDIIAKVMGQSVTLINPAVGTAYGVRMMLETENMMRSTVKKPSLDFYVSDFGQKFKVIGSGFLNQDIGDAQKIDIENY